jgi:hypothetical protein
MWKRKRKRKILNMEHKKKKKQTKKSKEERKQGGDLHQVGANEEENVGKDREKFLWCFVHSNGEMR